ncbi:helix-turn-helix transcriptional regulator [Spirillospora sp. NPDC049024]
MELLDRIHRLAARGDDLTRVRAEVDRLLRRAVGYDIAAVSTVDPATLLWTSCFVSGLDPQGSAERERVLFGLEFEGGDPNGYAELAAAASPVASLHRATGGDLSRARRYRLLLRGLDVVDEARVVLRSREGCWGSLTLYRRAPATPFTDDELTLLAAVSTPIADLFRLTLLRAALAAPDGLDHPPGMLLVTAAGEVEVSSADARAWLEAVDDRGRLPSALRAVAAAASSGDGLARAALPARDGRWVVLHGSPASGGEGAADRVAVIIEGARPAVLSEVIAGAYGLTPRERQITGLAAQGRSTRQMAAALGISPFTVQDHLKAVFGKTGVRSRGELVAALYSRHYAPRAAASTAPGPYGWYLDEHVAAV